MFVWKNALEANPTVHDPSGAGWIIRGSTLTINWTDQPPAPDAVSAVSYGCKGQCQTQRCSCVKSNFPCDDACICGDHCRNRLQETSTEDSEVDDSDKDDNSDGFSDGNLFGASRQG